MLLNFDKGGNEKMNGQSIKQYVIMILIIMAGILIIKTVAKKVNVPIASDLIDKV